MEDYIHITSRLVRNLARCDQNRKDAVIIGILIGVGLAELLIGIVIGYRICEAMVGDISDYYSTPNAAENNNLGDTEIKPLFYYCPKEEIIQAYRVGSEYYPDWMTDNKNITVTIFPSNQVIVSQHDGIIIANDGEYVIHSGDGIKVLPEKLFEETYQVIE